MTIAETSPEADKIVDDVYAALVAKAVGDIHRAVGLSFPNKRVTADVQLKAGKASLVGAFLLSCCAIEAAGHFYTGASGSRHSFECFTEQYVGNQYEPTVLYKALRCGLAHSYSLVSDDARLKERYDLTHNEPLLHLQPDNGDPYIRYINLQNFIVDVTAAVEKFLAEVKANINHERYWFLHHAETGGWLSEFVQPLPLAHTVTPSVPPLIPPQPAWVATALPFGSIWNGLTPPTIVAGKVPGSKYIIRPVAPGYALPSGALCTLTIAGSGHTNPTDLGVSGTPLTATAATRTFLLPNTLFAISHRNERRLLGKKHRKR